MNRICFFIGAHKTGTTYVNKTLLLNQAEINQRDIRVEITSTMKSNLTNLILRNDAKSRKLAQKFIYDKIDSYNRCIFSHENISGLIPSFYNKRTIYPNIGHRVKNLRAMMDGKKIDLVFSIRPYTGFVIASYSEYIRGNEGYIPFNAFRKTVIKKGISWKKVIDDIKQNYPEADLHIYEQSVLRHDQQKIFKLLLGQSIEMQKIKKSKGRPSISHEGFAIVNLLQEHGVDHNKKLINQIASILPKGDKFRAYDPWSKSMKQKLEDQYASDLDEIDQITNLIRG